jgi:hypothetical protein
MRGAKAVEPFHEPEQARLDSEGFTRFRFMVRERGRNAMVALHEPGSEDVGLILILLLLLLSAF